MSSYFNPEAVVIGLLAGVLPRLKMKYVAAMAAIATATITITSNCVFFLLVGGLVLALGFDGATLGLFLALSIFLCRLWGTRGNNLSLKISGKSLYSIFFRHATRRRHP